MFFFYFVRKNIFAWVEIHDVCFFFLPSIFYFIRRAKPERQKTIQHGPTPKSLNKRANPKKKTQTASGPKNKVEQTDKKTRQRKRVLHLTKGEDTCQPETPRRDTRHTTRHRHRTRPKREVNVGEDGKQPRASPKHARNRTTTPNSPRTLTRTTAITSNDCIGRLLGTTSSIVRVREINRKQIEISSMLRSAITTNPTYTSITPKGTQLQQPNHPISTAGEWNGSRHSATTP